MDLLKQKSLFVIIIIIWHLSACKNVDSDSMQPIDGYPMVKSTEEIELSLKRKCVDTIKFRNGEIIADIGAGNGYLEAMLSIYNDSLTFYIQDIDTSVCNQNIINDVVDFYQKVNGRPFTNKFIAVNGTDTRTNLPDNNCDKILMLWTYQYLKSPREFIKDVREKLKDEGLFYVINPNINYESEPTTSNGWNGAPIEKEISDIIDCGFELIRVCRNYDSPELPFIMVFKKKNL
ncbi:MAG TPA: methyltransferase domain-containing protein [Bacteroidales bacterium]|nr:methyltransferase domain-containing protein [Bacteroidales bacterium]